MFSKEQNSIIIIFTADHNCPFLYECNFIAVRKHKIETFKFKLLSSNSYGTRLAFTQITQTGTPPVGLVITH
jgi:hypothetical protein